MNLSCESQLEYLSPTIDLLSEALMLVGVRYFVQGRVNNFVGVNANNIACHIQRTLQEHLG